MQQVTSQSVKVRERKMTQNEKRGIQRKMEEKREKG